MSLHRLEQAALDALAAAERRGFDRALALIQEKLQASPNLCINLDSLPKTEECRAKVEIVIDDETGEYIESKKIPLSDVFYEQWDDKGSIQSISDGVKRSLKQLDHIIENWGTEAAREKVV